MTRDGYAEHLEHGDLGDIVRGLVTRMRIPWLLRHHEHVTVLAAFSFVSGCVSIAVMSSLAVVTGSPFIFPSLGPTAFLFFHAPLAASASPRNAILGHLIGVCAGYVSLLLTGLANSEPAIMDVTWPRVVAAALSLGLTSGLMVLFRASHPPAGATTLIVSLSILTHPLQLVVLMAGVVLLVLLAIVINRLAGVRYPLWKAPPSPKNPWRSDQTSDNRDESRP